ncbi:hypothetical protein Ndes2526B_g02822 [Nannochloris sp. 'desiccata']|nr:putative Protein LPA3 [Chlorella desiccata (nom. nud.)]
MQLHHPSQVGKNRHNSQFKKIARCTLNPHLCSSTKRAASCHAASKGEERLVPFPDEFPACIKQAQEATLAALADGHRLIEIDFPSAGLRSVAGDAEGANEMTYNMQHLRQFTRIWQEKSKAATTRIFFPDIGELKVAQCGKKKDPNAGSWDLDAVWDQTSFQLDYLTKPSGLLDIGIDLSKNDPASRVKPTDELLIMAYPSFDPREMDAVGKVWNGAAKEQGQSIILFNAELDRLRNGYYPSLFYPKMAKLSKEFIPDVEAAYYLHNFKGAGGGALFRAYPGPWQVLLRLQEGMRVVHTQEERPSLKQVALEFLPAAVRKLRQQQSVS